jgi:hypothetical protein
MSEETETLRAKVREPEERLQIESNLEFDGARYWRVREQKRKVRSVRHVGISIADWSG